MKLHLGCGELYLDGYVNIDYPLTEHSIQQKSVADKLADLRELRYPAGTIEEIRLHHVFEHFTRATACAFLASWNSWLTNDGILRIEVPDFERTGKVALSKWRNPKEKSIALRHIFGSQEAHWAVHYHGYTASSLSRLMELFGYKVKEVLKKNNLGILHNIDITGIKVSSISKSNYRQITAEYLNGFMAADVESERMMVQTWLKEYDQQIGKTFASE